MQSQNRSEKTQSMKNRIMAVCLIITTLVSGLFAFLTDTEKVDNVFTVGDVKIKLLEPNWDEDAGKDLWAGKVLTKDPQIKNEGSNSAYVYMMVRVPKKDVKVYDGADGTADIETINNGVKTTELFSYTINAPVAEVPASGDTAAVPAQPGWILKDSELTGDNYNFYLYYYDTALASGDTTGTLFDTVTFANVTENQFDDKKGDNAKNDLDIYIEAYAIQSQFGDDSDAIKLDADAAWDYYATQNGWSFDKIKVEDEDDGTQEGVSIPTLTEPGAMFYKRENVPVTVDSLKLYTSQNPWELNSQDLLYMDDAEIETWISNFYNSDSTISILTKETIVLTWEELKNDWDVSDTSIGENAFGEIEGWNDAWGTPELICIAIPDSVTSIGEQAFAHCPNLASITIPDSVTNIGDNAFYGCNGLLSISVDSDNTVYDSRDNCNAIIETETNTLITGCKNTVIPNSVTSIGDNAFAYCYGLTSITIPDSVTSIGDNAFFDCTGLTSIIVESGNSVYDSRNNCNAIIETSTNTLIVGCENTVIPNGIASIKHYAFYHCANLKNITIPEGVTSIGDEAFSNCTSLSNITIPDSVTRIGTYAFRGCTGLTSINVPDSVTDVGMGAFDDCSCLMDISRDTYSKLRKKDRYLFAEFEGSFSFDNDYDD